MSKTILKWAGGKKIIIQKIKERLEKINNKENVTFFDLFAGGGSVSFEFSSMFNKTILNDINKELINVFTVLKTNPNELLALLKEHENNHSKEYYYQIRALDRNADYDNLSDLIKAARIIYLNKTCYNGLYRVNKNNQFNVPFGRYKNVKIYDENVFFEIHEKLKRIIIKNEDFSKIVNECKAGDVVYFDPPYDKVNGNSFVDYNANGFNTKDQERLAKAFQKLTKNGVYAILSNSITTRTEELYKDFINENSKIKVRRSISPNAKTINGVAEFLIDNIEQVNKIVNQIKKNRPKQSFSSSK